MAHIYAACFFFFFAIVHHAAAQRSAPFLGKAVNASVQVDKMNDSVPPASLDLASNTCAALGKYCGGPGQRDLDCCNGVCDYFLDSPTKLCIYQDCVWEGQKCGQDNVQHQACCSDLQCQPLLGGRDMQCMKPHETCVAAGEYCGGHDQTTLECCSGICEYPANSATKQCIDHAPCTDTPNWTNGFSGCKSEVPSWSGDEFCTNEGWTCSGYAWHGWCMNNHAYFGGGNYFKNPEWNCCACKW